MLTQLLTAILKPEHRKAGMYLEKDADILFLMRDDKVLDYWDATKATIKQILEFADRYLK